MLLGQKSQKNRTNSTNSIKMSKTICIKKIFKKLTKRNELVRWIIGKLNKSMDQVVPLLGGQKEHGRF